MPKNNLLTNYIYIYIYIVILVSYQILVIYARCVTLYRWPTKQTIPLSVLARNQTKGFWTWNLAVSGSGKGTRKRVGWRKELTGSWRGTTDRGSRLRTPEQRGEPAWDRVQRRRPSQDVGIPVVLWFFRK